MTSEIPEGVQRTVTDVASRMEHFVERARNGGSWIELQTWLISMQPGIDLLTDLGLDGIRKAARMPITPERQEEIAAAFTVPHAIPKDDCICTAQGGSVYSSGCPRHDPTLRGRTP